MRHAQPTGQYKQFCLGKSWTSFFGICGTVWRCVFLVVLIVSGVTSVVGQPGDVPAFEGFHKITAVSKWIGDLAARGDASFSVGALARA